MTDKSMKRDTPATAMLRVFGITALALVVLLGLQAPASAQSVCMTHAEITNLLDSQHSQAPVAIGRGSNDRMVEVFSARDGSTWTIVVTTLEGQSCIIASGGDWHLRRGTPHGQQV